ncbi:enolase [Candidatus Acidianus copahuensis]|uniref:Enolase n=1 Tax=Candidatus Acidianus copahuensis TaxID=1160895 RepID=A0A031LP76_9CREN|nr:phosphopyruvate hydratase [Candidatus Acidianus copahuensis]EZQ06862.1 enolase [Candidatus Acidianus copahuensis]
MTDFEITDVKGLEILDSRGNRTIRVFVKTEYAEASGDAPAGASKGSREALELRDKNGSALPAVSSVNNFIKYGIIGMDVRNQEGIDQTMISMDGTPNKSRLGANATIATSIAVAKTASMALGEEIFEYIGGHRRHEMPIPLLNILNGGLHAGNGLKIQEFLIVPIDFDTFSEALFAAVDVYKELKNLIAERYGKIYTALGDEGGISPPLSNTEDALSLVYTAIKNSGYDGKIFMGMDAASSDFYNIKENVYEIDGIKKNDENMLDFYEDITQRYPIIYIEDPFNENDFDNFSKLQQRLKNIIVVGDDLYTTSVKTLKEGIKKGSTKGVIVKPNQIGTLTETFEFFDTARENNIKTIVSHRSGETEDNFIADLAVGLNSDFIKTGAPSRGERTSKYNRLLEIENIYNLSYRGRFLH